jgi:hypothetical protein
MKSVLCAFALALAAASSAPAAARAEAAAAAAQKVVYAEGFASAGPIARETGADGLNAMLIEALLADGRWAVMEAADGEAKGVIVRGAVTRYEPEAGGGGLDLGGVSRLGAGRGAVSGKRAVVAVTLRLTDASSGRILAVASAEGTANSRSAEASGIGAAGGHGGAQAFANTPVGAAAEEAIRKAVAELSAKLDKLP